MLFVTNIHFEWFGGGLGLRYPNSELDCFKCTSIIKVVQLSRTEDLSLGDQYLIRMQCHQIFVRFIYDSFKQTRDSEFAFNDAGLIYMTDKVYLNHKQPIELVPAMLLGSNSIIW